MAAVSRPREGRKHRSTAAEYGCDFAGETADPETDALGCKRRALRASGAHRDPAAGRQSYSGYHSGHSVRSRDSRPPLYGRAGIHYRQCRSIPEILRERGKVIADYEERKAKIKADAEEAARKIGGNADLSESLLEEVASLVEWPVVLTAKFEEKFSRCRLKRWFTP